MAPTTKLGPEENHPRHSHVCERGAQNLDEAVHRPYRAEVNAGDILVERSLPRRDPDDAGRKKLLGAQSSGEKSRYSARHLAFVAAGRSNRPRVVEVRVFNRQGIDKGPAAQLTPSSVPRKKRPCPMTRDDSWRFL